jgi:hypothetical protein
VKTIVVGAVEECPIEDASVPEPKKLQHRSLHAVLWGVFALLTLAGGYTMLRACDLGIRPLFGFSFCIAPQSDTALAAERERQDQLRTNLHSAELRLAQLPICPPPPKPVPPKPVPPPKPVTPPKPVPPPDPVPPPKPVENLNDIKKVEDLKGCWQSAGGDIDIVTDDAEHKPLGKARFCYCFGDSGRGTAQVRYTDGDLCRAPLQAKTQPGKVLLHHEQIPCQTHGPFIGEDITCANSQSNETTCEIQNLGKNLRQKFSQQFIRVTEEHCGWGG